MARSLSVEIVGDSRLLEQAFARSTRSANKFGREMESTATRSRRAFAGIGKAAVGAFAAVGVTASIKSAVSAASDLQQQISKTDVVFGKSAEGVEAWSKTLIKSFGLSRREALTTASGFGALFAPLGIIGPKAAEQSERLTQLGADLASFYNTDVASALEAVRSGIVGESEPLRQYGVQLSESRVQQEALHETGKRIASQLTNQEKVLARVALIWKDTSKAQGDFGRTADTAANQLKIFTANMENLKASLGGSLIPALTSITEWLNKIGPHLNTALKMWRIFFASLVGLALKTFSLIVEPFSHLPGALGGWARDAKNRVKGELDTLNAYIAELNRKAGGPVAGQTGADVPRPKHPIINEGTVTSATASAGLTKKERQARLGRIRAAQEAFRQLLRDQAAFAVDRAAATKGLTDDLAALNKYNELLSRQIKGGHKTLALEREQFQVQQQIADVLKQQSEARRAARDARQFRLLGLGPTGEALVPGVKALRRELGSVEGAISGTFLDTKKTRSMITRIRRALTDGLKGMSRDVRAAIQTMLNDLEGQIKKKSVSVDQTKFHKVAPGILGALGLNEQQRKVLSRILPQLGPGGTLPTASGQFAGAMVVHGGVHLHGVQNVKQMENELLKRRKQRAQSRRGTR